MTGSLQTKKGKYYAVYRDDRGKQKWVPLNLPVAGNNKRKAQQRLREVLVEAEKNQSVITSNVLFIDWMLAWLDQKQASISKGTYEGYKLYLDKHIIPYYQPQKLTLSKLNAQHLQGYFNAKIKEGQSACTLHKLYVLNKLHYVIFFIESGVCKKVCTLHIPDVYVTECIRNNIAEL